MVRRMKKLHVFDTFIFLKISHSHSFIYSFFFLLRLGFMRKRRENQGVFYYLSCVNLKNQSRKKNLYELNNISVGVRGFLVTFMDTVPFPLIKRKGNGWGILVSEKSYLLIYCPEVKRKKKNGVDLHLTFEIKNYP